MCLHGQLTNLKIVVDCLQRSKQQTKLCSTWKGSSTRCAIMPGWSVPEYTLSGITARLDLYVQV